MKKIFAAFNSKQIGKAVFFLITAFICPQDNGTLGLLALTTLTTRRAEIQQPPDTPSNTSQMG